MTAGAPSRHVLFGETGYWQHLGEALQRRIVTARHPLQIDIVIPDDGFFAARSWHEEFDREIRSYLLTENLLTGRIIAPPSALGAPAEPVLDLALDSGFEVRTLPTTSRYVIYDNDTVVLSSTKTVHTSTTTDKPADTQEVHGATQLNEVVEPLRQLFKQQWSAATPWVEIAHGENPVLDLLAQGWTDERIAQALGISHRTISRRVAAMMASNEAESRFELGMKHGIALARRQNKRR